MRSNTLIALISAGMSLLITGALASNMPVHIHELKAELVHPAKHSAPEPAFHSVFKGTILPEPLGYKSLTRVEFPLGKPYQMRGFKKDWGYRAQLDLLESNRLSVMTLRSGLALNPDPELPPSLLEGYLGGEKPTPASKEEWKARYGAGKKLFWKLIDLAHKTQMREYARHGVSDPALDAENAQENVSSSHRSTTVLVSDKGKTEEPFAAAVAVQNIHVRSEEYIAKVDQYLKVMREKYGYGEKAPPVDYEGLASKKIRPMKNFDLFEAMSKAPFQAIPQTADPARQSEALGYPEGLRDGFEFTHLEQLFKVVLPREFENDVSVLLEPMHLAVARERRNEGIFETWGALLRLAKELERSFNLKRGVQIRLLCDGKHKPIYKRMKAVTLNEKNRPLYSLKQRKLPVKERTKWWVMGITADQIEAVLRALPSLSADEASRTREALEGILNPPKPE